MDKNNFEVSFNTKVADIINTQIDLLNKHPVILKEVLPAMYNKVSNFKLTDSILLYEIKDLFEEDCITERTYKNIKYGNTSSSAFNVFIIIYVLNDLTSEVNKKYEEYGKKDSIPLITLDLLMDPLNG